MSMLPLIVSLADDLYEPWESFGLGLHPHEFMQVPRSCYRRRNCGPVERQRRGQCQRSDHVQKMGKDGFQVSMDVSQFAPNEISVKTVDSSVVVEGRHEEKEDEHGFIQRHFVRRYQLPKDCDVKEVVSTLSSDGVLTVKAPPLSKAIKGSERVIHIQQTGPAKFSVKDNSKEAEDKEKSPESK